ncbi:MAG TPA: TniQ family protein, partial [Planctomicrobium sp.]|nr:TniQ family protein [Planctomicrobium sp.]
MERLPKLPAREPVLPGESLESLIRRHALAMGYEHVGRVLAPVRERGELPPSFNHLFSGPVLEGLGELFGIPTASLLQMTVHCFAEQLVLARQDEPLSAECDSKTILRFFRRGTSPVCLECLQEEPVHEQLLWSFAPIPICPVHGVVLIDHCSDCRRPLSPSRLDIRRCRCGRLLLDTRQVALPVHLTSLSKTVQGWLLGKTSPIPDLSIAAQFWWLERLFSAVRRTPSWIAELRQRDSIPTETPEEKLAWLAAAEMLIEWPRRFEEFLEVFQTVTKHRTTSTGVSRSFGLLLREAKWLEDLGCPAPAEVLRTYLLQRYTQGHLSAKVCLFQGTAKARMKDRPWLTRTQAAKQLGVRHGAVTDWVQRGLLSGEIRVAGAHGRSVGVVSRDSVAVLRRQFASSVTIPVAAKRLGIGRRAVLEMVHRNLLEKSIRTVKGWLIPKEAIEDWEAFMHHLPVRNGTSPDWLMLREATKRFGKSGFTLAVVLDLVRSGRVEACRSDKASMLGTILVDSNDLQSNREAILSQQNSESGYSVHRLAKILIPERPLKAIVLQKWIAAGLLGAKRHGRMRIVSPDEVNRFRKTYCLADEACSLLGISRTTLSRWEEAGRITAVYSRRSHEGAGASVFLQNDVENRALKRPLPMLKNSPKSHYECLPGRLTTVGQASHFFIHQPTGEDVLVKFSFQDSVVNTEV